MGLVKICAFGLGLLGTIMVWQAGGLIARNTLSDLSFYDLLFDPAFSVRVLAGMAAFFAGLAALTELRGSSWLSGAAVFLLGIIITVLLMDKAVDLDAFRTELIMLILMTCLSLAIVVARSQMTAREEAASNALSADNDDAIEGLPAT